MIPLAREFFIRWRSHYWSIQLLKMSPINCQMFQILKLKDGCSYGEKEHLFGFFYHLDTKANWTPVSWYKVFSIDIINVLSADPSWILWQWFYKQVDTFWFWLINLWTEGGTVCLFSVAVWTLICGELCLCSCLFSCKNKTMQILVRSHIYLPGHKNGKADD